MPVAPQHTFPIPNISLPTLLFTSPRAALSESPLFISSISSTTHYLTHTTYRLLSQRFAAGLLRHNFHHGDRLLLFSGNNIYFPAVFVGTIMAGGIFTGANPGYVARELAYQLKDSGTKFLLCARASMGTGLEAASMVGMGREQVFIFDDSLSDGESLNSPQAKKVEQRYAHWNTLLASEAQGRDYIWDNCDTPEKTNRTCVLNYSSGTTGVPKGVEISHRNYIANALHQKHLSSGTQPAERWLCFLPLYHAMAQTLYTTLAVLTETPVYIMPKFDFEDMLNCVQKFRITRLFLVPPILVAITKHPDVKAGKWDLSSLIALTCGAAPLGPGVIEELSANMGREMKVMQGYGLTETTCLALGWEPDKDYKSATVGRLAPNCEGKIMNEEGTKEVTQGERGELWVRGPNLMKGYWRNEEATRETITADGWLKTGDVCFIDADGLFYIVDRMKELIKVKGNQVAPAELEALLLGHPAIADAAVIGVMKDDDELPRAYIVRRAGQQVSENDIVAFIEQRVSRFKQITGGVRFIDAIPKNPSGKILRKILRENAKEEERKAISKL